VRPLASNPGPSRAARACRPSSQEPTSQGVELVDAATLASWADRSGSAGILTAADGRQADSRTPA